MPAQEFIHEYYLHQHRNLENYLELCLIHPEIELVHELRLCIKKLRAFHKLAEHLFLNDSDEHIHIKNRVRKLFVVAGKLRDTQVQIHMLTLFEEKTGIDYTDFRKWLQRLENKQILRFNKKPQQVIPHAMAQSTHQKIVNQLALADDETILRGAGKVLEELLLSAQNLASGNMNDRNLHRLRTITKRIKYILNIIHHSYPDYTFNAVPIESLRKMEAIAGHWHDNLVRIELLDRFINKVKFADDSKKFKYQKLYFACKSELDISYSEAFVIMRKELHPGSPDNGIQ